MRLVTYRDRDRRIKPGVLQGEEIVDISDQVADISSLIEEGPDALGRSTDLSAGQDAPHSACGCGIAGSAPKPAAHLLRWTGISRSRH